MKKIFVLLALVFLVTGCSVTEKQTIENVVDDVLASNQNFTNKHFSGYEYYLPRGVSMTNKLGYNSTLKYRSNQIYLYKSIFETLEEYIKEILPIKLKNEEMPSYDKVLKEYEEYEKFSVGKLDEKEFVEKNMILLGLSRILFTHSLPLVAAEQCYNKLLRDTRNLIIKTGNPEKKEDVYQILLKLIEDYNVKLLSTKVYWEKPEEREIYKKFWNEYSKATSSEDKEILALRRELHDLKAEDSDKMVYLKNFYKRKLVEFGKMRLITKLRKVENIKYIKNK